jgi:hypothetical protein
VNTVVQVNTQNGDQGYRSSKNEFVNQKSRKKSCSMIFETHKRSKPTRRKKGWRGKKRKERKKWNKGRIHFDTTTYFVSLAFNIAWVFSLYKNTFYRFI